MARAQSSSPRTFLHRLVAADELRRHARRVGFFKRMRKVDPVKFLLVVVLGLCGRGGQSVAAMRRRFSLETGVELARSAFWDRFTPAFEAWVLWLLCHLESLAAEREVRLQGILAGFRDVIAVDATVIKVHDSLVGTWRGTRRDTAPAALKVHTWVRVATGELLQHRITREAYSDMRAFGINWKAAGKLFLLDRGYPSASLWWRIHRVGGRFLTRLPKSHKPWIVGENRRHRGRARKLTGQRFWGAVAKLQRQVIDVDCSFRIHIGRYGGRRGRYEQVTFRVVGLWNHERKRHHFYVTNLRPEAMPATRLGDIYRLRWEVETFYKTAKGGLGLAELPSRKAHIVRTLIYAALIRTTIAMMAKHEAHGSLPAGRWINPGQWTCAWREALPSLLRSFLEPRPQAHPPSWATLARLAMDHNRSRPPTRWRLCSQFSGITGQAMLHGS